MDERESIPKWGTKWRSSVLHALVVSLGTAVAAGLAYRRFNHGIADGLLYILGMGGPIFAFALLVGLLTPRTGWGTLVAVWGATALILLGVWSITAHPG